MQFTVGSMRKGRCHDDMSASGARNGFAGFAHWRQGWEERLLRQTAASCHPYQYITGTPSVQQGQSSTGTMPLERSCRRRLAELLELIARTRRRYARMIDRGSARSLRCPRRGSQPRSLIIESTRRSPARFDVRRLAAGLGRDHPGGRIACTMSLTMLLVSSLLDP